jgi:hypothetical protein
VNVDIAACVASWSAVTATAPPARTDPHGTFTVIGQRRYASFATKLVPVTVRSANGAEGASREGERRRAARRWGSGAQDRIGRRGPAVATMAVGTVVTVGGSLLPWVATGAKRRNSYDLLSLVERLGFAPDGPVDPALRWWPLMPLLAVLALVAAWWGWPRAGGAVGVIAGLYAGAVGVAVTQAPSGLVDILPGAPVTVGGALVLAAGSIGAVVVGWRDGLPEDVRPTGPGSSARPAAPPDGRS